ETNSYSSRATRLADFEAFELLAGDAILAHHRGKGSVIGGFLEGLGEAEAIPLFSAGAWPAAPPDAPTANILLARLEESLAGAPRLDGILVNLHGAMTCEGIADMEAATLAAIRRRFPAIPVMAVLDLHANVSLEACRLCDAVIGYRTYPHVDMAACGRELAQLMRRATGGERFAMAYSKIGELTSPMAQGTGSEPMKGILARAESLAAAAGIERISLLPGFPYSDVERCGFTILAVAQADRADRALDCVAAVRADVEAHLPGFRLVRPKADAAVREALLREEKPVVLADLADNVGGGSPGDGTAILSELVRQGARGAVAIIADAEAAVAAAAAGPGASVDLMLGGKSDMLHGPPLPVRARVMRLGDGRYRTNGTWMTGQAFSMGPSAVLEIDPAITVLVTSTAVPPFHIEQLTGNGIDPRTASIIVVKGAVAWRDAYGPVMASAIEVDTPGCCPLSPAALPRTTRPRDMGPMLIRRD
ncbi:MAG: M81 family metallopeptidase, partial [Rhizobiales bacterium]|nr:M81 family metallopeptidase [Hyphomicrobiales bacterium]